MTRKKLPYLPDRIQIIWQVDDILSIDDSLTNRECREILDHIKRTHQADIGINWEVIQCAIHFYKLDNGIK